LYVITNYILCKLWLFYRKVFPVDIIGLHLSDDIEALLFIYCQHQAELKPGTCLCVGGLVEIGFQIKTISSLYVNWVITLLVALLHHSTKRWKPSENVKYWYSNFNSTWVYLRLFPYCSSIFATLYKHALMCTHKQKYIHKYL